MNNIKNGQSAAEQIFKPVRGWEGLYEVTNDGKVFSIRSNRFLKPRLSCDGYERVALCKDGKNYEMRVHRLVAEAFIGNPHNLPQVNHKDFNKQNNWFENLEWCTNYENSHYSMIHNRPGFGNQKSIRDSITGRFDNCKIYTFTNVYNNKQFSIIGMKNILKQFKCSLKNVTAILCKYANTGMYVKQGYFKGLRIDTQYLKVHRPTANHGVGESSPKYWISFEQESDMVSSVSKDAAVINGVELTNLHEQ